MKVKALWGFMGHGGRVMRGQEIEVDDEYGHTLVGKGLVKEVKGAAKQAEPKETQKANPAANKQAAPKENK